MGLGHRPFLASPALGWLSQLVTNHIKGEIWAMTIMAYDQIGL